MRRLYRPLLAAASSSRRHVVSMASAASTAGIIASGVAAPLAALYVGQRSVIYPRPPVYDDAKAYGGEHAEIVRADGVVGRVGRAARLPCARDALAAALRHGASRVFRFEFPRAPWPPLEYLPGVQSHCAGRTTATSASPEHTWLRAPGVIASGPGAIQLT